MRDLGIRETGILMSCSDYHIFKKMKLTRSEAMKKYLDTVREAFDAGVMPRCHRRTSPAPISTALWCPLSTS